MAAGDLTTLTAARDYLRLEDTLDDAWIESLVSSSSAWFKSELGRDILATDYTWTCDGEGTRGLTLPQYPVISVTSVTVDGTVVPQRTTVTGDGWVLDGDRIALVGYYFTRGVQNVAVVYRAGYATVPTEIVQAVIEHVGLRYRDRDWGAATMRIAAGELIDHRGASSAGAWAYIRGVLDKYQRVRA